MRLSDLTLNFVFVMLAFALAGSGTHCLAQDVVPASPPKLQCFGSLFGRFAENPIIGEVSSEFVGDRVVAPSLICPVRLQQGASLAARASTTGGLGKYDISLYIENQAARREFGPGNMTCLAREQASAPPASPSDQLAHPKSGSDCLIAALKPSESTVKPKSSNAVATINYTAPVEANYFIVLEFSDLEIQGKLTVGVTGPKAP